MSRQFLEMRTEAPLSSYHALGTAGYSALSLYPNAMSSRYPSDFTDEQIEIQRNHN